MGQKHSEVQLTVFDINCMYVLNDNTYSFQCDYQCHKTVHSVCTKVCSFSVYYLISTVCKSMLMCTFFSQGMVKEIVQLKEILGKSFKLVWLFVL